MTKTATLKIPAGFRKYQVGGDHLYGRARTDTVHLMLMHEGGNKMRSWCGRYSGWASDNWTDKLPEEWDDVCVHCFRLARAEKAKA